MTNTKAALDAFNSIIAIQIPKTDELGQYAVNLVRQALTTPPAPTEADKYLQAAIKRAKEFRENQVYYASNHKVDQVKETFSWIDTLIRAATQPPQVTDAVPREVVEKAKAQIERGIICHERHRSYDKDGWLFSRIHFNEALALLGGKEG